jgi:hypothetical protein
MNRVSFIFPTPFIELNLTLIDKDSILNKVYIAKPEASSQGKGIYLVTSPADVPKDCRYVVQEYLNE